MIRAVLDPGVLISGLISASGSPSTILRAWQDGLVEIVTCPHLIDELRRALDYPKVRSRVSMTEADTLVVNLVRGSVHHPDPDVIDPVCLDPEDDYLFALARESGSVLVSGDRKVLAVAHAGVRVLRPAALTELF